MIEPLRASSVVARINPLTAETLWSGTSALFELDSPSYGYGDSLVLSDGGSAIIIAGAITRFSADGSTLWSRSIVEPNDYVWRRGVALAGGDFLLFKGISNRIEITRIAIDSGITVETLTVTGNPGVNCTPADVASADAVTAYAASRCLTGGLVQIRTAPLRVTWHGPADLPAPISISTVLTDGDGVYVLGSAAVDSIIRRLSPTDGTTVWTTPNVQASRIALDPQGNLVSQASEPDCAHRITRYATTNGAPMWSITGAGVVNDIAFSAGLIVAVGDECTQAPAESVGFASWTALQDGAPGPRTAIASPRTGPMTVSSVAAVGSRVFASGNSCVAETFEEDCYSAFWQTDAPAVPMQPAELAVESATLGTAVIESDQTTWVAALEWTSAGQALRLRKYRNADGAILTDTLRPAPLLHTPWLAATKIQAVATDDGDIAVLYGASVNYIDLSNVTIVKVNATTGVTRWQLGMFDTSAWHTSVDATMTDDSAGNLVVSTLEKFYAPTPRVERGMRKLDAATGTEVWRRGFDPLENSAGVTPPFASRIGDDVFTFEVPIGEQGIGWTRLRGSDGSLVWNNPSIPIGNLLDAETSGTTIVNMNSGLRLVRFDSATGAVQWTTTYAETGDSAFSNFGFQNGTANDLYLGGAFTSRPTPASASLRRGYLMRVDETTGSISWVNRFDDNPAAIGARLNPRGLHAGAVHSTQLVNIPNAGSGFMLTSASQADGSVIGTQFLYAGYYGMPQLPDELGSGVLGLLGNGQAIIAGSWRLPGKPHRFTLSSLDAPEPHAGGALSVSLVTVPSTSADGLTFSFTFDASNTGSINAPQVRAVLAIPTNARVDAVSCSLASVACAPRVAASSIDGTFDIASGGTLHITGTLTVPSGTSAASAFGASAFAPYGFVELDMKDNVASTTFTDVIMRNGFDP